MTAPLATVVVVTYNSRRWFARQRTALEAQSETRWRLVVVDNASRSEERPTGADLPAGAHIMQMHANLGFAEANNRAAARTRSRYLIFLNPDAFPEPDWMAHIIALAERHPGAAAIGSTQVRADAPHQFDGTGDVMHASGLAYRSNYGRPRGRPPPLGESFAACGAAMLVRRDAFEAAGGFDSRYFCYFEDVDLCFRLRLAGHAILQSPTAVVAHVGGGAAGVRNPFADYHGARNRVWTFFKCMPAPLLWPLLPLHMLANVAAVSVALASGRGLAAWRGFIAGLAGLGPIWAARRGLQRERRASWREIASALAWNPLVVVGRLPVIRPPKAPLQAG